MKKSFLSLTIIIVLFISGCGYKLGSMTIGGITTICILPVENKSVQTFIDETILLNELTREFTKDGTVKIVQKDLADAFLKINITDYSQHAQAFSNENVGSFFRMILVADVSVLDKKTKKPFYIKTFTGYATFDTGIDQSEIEGIAFENAVKDLSLRIVRAINEEGDW